MENQNMFSFPIGYHRFHKKQLYNFQLNRWHSLGYLSYDDLKIAGEKIRKFDDWKPVMLEQANNKLDTGKNIEAAFFYRAAEFYTLYGQEDKELLYDKFIDLFYSNVPLEGVHVEKVSYNESFLHVLRMPNKSGIKKGTILIHIGFDSFIEEFYSVAWYFTIKGYDVIAFDGPGQGKTIKKFNIPFDLVPGCFFKTS